MENNLLFKNKVVYLQHKRTTKNKNNNSNKSLTTDFKSLTLK